MRGVILSAGFAGLLLCAASVAAAEPVMLTDSELAEERGGISTPFGFEVGFGATVSTFVDGQLALQTTLTWTDQGLVTGRAGSLAATAIGSPLQSGGLTAQIPGVGGSTQIIQNLADGRIASVILNTANGRDLRQDTDLTLTLPQLPQMQQELNASRISASLQSALGLVQSGAAGSN